MCGVSLLVQAQGEAGMMEIPRKSSFQVVLVSSGAPMASLEAEACLHLKDGSPGAPVIPTPRLRSGGGLVVMYVEIMFRGAGQGTLTSLKPVRVLSCQKSWDTQRLARCGGTHL